MATQEERLLQLTNELARAAKAYYTGKGELMDNYTYDKKYDELLALEEQLDFFFPESPTRYVGYTISDKAEKVKHEYPALSLDKTKSREELADWLGDNRGVLSWKLDGLTCQLTYHNGRLVMAATRGNGEIGEDITRNAKNFIGVPQEIEVQSHLVVRGEAFMEYGEFERVNAFYGGKYDNPRNLASSVVRARDERIPASCKIHFMAFELVHPKTYYFYKADAFECLRRYGFDVVPYRVVSRRVLGTAIADFEASINNGTVAFPTDGLVLTYNNIAYGQSLGVRGKSPRHSIAFKWADETERTTLRDVEWSCSRTGLINPVAIFDPVEIDGATITRASVHNLSYMRQKQLSIGSEIEVYRANMVIPQIAECVADAFDIPIPERCPVCGSPTERQWNEDGSSEFLCCPNQNCGAKMVGKFERLCCRDALNIEGLSTKTIEAFCSRGWLVNYADIFQLPYDEIAQLDGFGGVSAQNIREAVEKSRHTSTKRLLYGLGIPYVGRDVAGALSDYCGGDWAALWSFFIDGHSTMTFLDGVGPKIGESIRRFFDDGTNVRQVEELVCELTVEVSPSITGDDSLSGLTFVITGKLTRFKNRDELVGLIQSYGGKVAGSVSKNTTALINNDTESTSGKNKKAKELGVVILSENDLFDRYPLLGS